MRQRGYRDRSGRLCCAIAAGRKHASGGHVEARRGVCSVSTVGIELSCAWIPRRRVWRNGTSWCAGGDELRGGGDGSDGGVA